MADKHADLSPEDKEKRVAELKAKMQAAAQKARSSAAEPALKPAAAAREPDVAPPQPARTGQVAESVAENVPESVPVAPAPETKAAGAGPSSNGAASNNGSAAAAVPATTVWVAEEPAFVEDTPEQKARKEMNRREFLTYAWGATLGLLLLEMGAATYFFMYPRFKAGEFGGQFFIGPETSLPPVDAPPEAHIAGKFWLVNTTDVGPKALYMVCTHLGCLYKWAQSNNRFECPCHGSKFSREGFYIEGPAPRSLDTFAISVEGGVVVVDTGKKTAGAPSAESPARAVPV